MLRNGQDWLPLPPKRTSLPLPPGRRRAILRRMPQPASLNLLVLDDEWRPLHRLRADQDWRDTVNALLRWESRWLAIEQQRPDSPFPRWADIRLTRTLSKRLRPIEIALADQDRKSPRLNSSH